MPTTIITGGTGGVGLATAIRLLEDSDDRQVALVDLRTPDELPAELADFASRVGLFACDVASPESVQNAADQIADTMPELDSVVNSAGIVANDATIDVSPDLFHRMYGIHVIGSLLWSQHLARTLDGRPGVIVNVGSVAGQFAVPRRAAYAAAKAAVHSLTKTMAAEWAPIGIRVNAVAPGYIATPMMNEVTRLGTLDREKISSWHAMKRLAEPEEIADVIVFLLSDRATFVTGHILNADGGFAVLKAED